ncbi:MAG: DNA-directed RNA polymerase subunit beta' [Candidatus Cloacimonetes bacterium]|nr:DNA-directed RNA polymerase subunit beta' [Candidatus Cloacimonadota bacterium]MBT6993447.1 DNA-directed RNA polymerase subunit beta' [Candidatus Cloacimonadota bacterium]MBT7469559.1 DNA-directed RNA polymerase subunit beta' [Candidatus Cloacimonadota bacterium]
MIRKAKKDRRIENYDKVRIKIASPDTIREWSHGEVTKPDTLNYRTLKPEKGGLFCERIFGPEKDYECSCGKYKKKRFQDTVCDRCGVEITTSRVRRKRMGHIELAVPIAHLWFFKSMPSVISTILEMPVKKLEQVIYYESFVVINPGDSDYEKKDLIDVDEYYEIIDKVSGDFKAMMGAEALQMLLSEIPLEDESMKLQTIVNLETSVQKKTKAIKRLKVVDALRKSGNRPEWLVLEVLPVLPPTLRPLVQLEGGRFATADFNELYRRVITRNNRLRGLMNINAPEVILRNEKRMLQEAVDALIDNTRKTRPVKGRGNRPLKALADQLKGKSGRFRQNLLGKRVDYSGRSVIIVGPHLKIHQCGIPKEMAIELFKPFLIERLEKVAQIEKAKTTKKLIEDKRPEIWKILEEIMEDYPVLLNRAPTLHKHGIQAFEPVLTEGRAIELHPLVCIPYNADFDGDQMAVHVPLSKEAQMEARVLMLASRNLLLPASGKLAMATNQDIVLGNYYLTTLKDKDVKDKKKLRYLSSTEEVVVAYEQAELLKNSQNGKNTEFDIHTWINVLIDGKMVTTTVGRVIFNQIIPPEISFKNEVFTKSRLNDLAMECYETVGQHRTAEFLDDIKDMGFKYATKAGITFSASDVISPKEKHKFITKTEKEVQKIIDSYMNGEITETERYNRVVDKWKLTTDNVTKVLMEQLENDQDGFNSINMMYISGARGGKDQIKQLGAMRGLMDKPSRGSAEGGSEVIETPIKSNFKEGLTVLEYFISTHGARKGLADTALKTADAGYLTRRLVDIGQNAIITEEDCGTIESHSVSALKEGLEVVESLSERIKGRTAAQDIIDPVTDKILVNLNETITNEKAKIIQDHGINEVQIRSVVTCESKKGICARCYGRNLGNNKPVTIGEPVGIIAAQSIGEPGTQLTLRTFHIGGTTSTDVDRAEVVSDTDGTIKFARMNTVVNRQSELVSISNFGRIKIINNDGEVAEDYKVEYASTVFVNDGEKVVKDTKLFSWDHYNNPLIATAKGKLKFEHFIKDVTYKEEFNELTGMREITTIESKDRKKQAQFKIIQDDKKEELVPIPTNLSVEIEDGVYVHPGDILGKTSRISIKHSDITGGLPRVQDLFEARIPKGKAVLSEVAGRIRIGDLSKSGRVIYVKPGEEEEKKYVIPPGKRIIVHQGDMVESGDPLSSGPLDPHDILKAKGINAAQQLILNEIQEVYRKQGVKIQDKHIGVIIRQMFKKVKVITSGHTMFLEGEIIERNRVMQENKRIEEEGGEGATFEQLLLGITKSSLLTDSWLSAASFQETTKVLTQAAIEGKVDNLVGLKENIIVGRRIPIGTGTKHFNEQVKEAVAEGKTVSDIIEEIAHTEESITASVEELLDI